MTGGERENAGQEKWAPEPNGDVRVKTGGAEVAATRGWGVGAAASGCQALGCCAVRRVSHWVGPGGCTADQRKAGGVTGGAVPRCQPLAPHST